MVLRRKSKRLKDKQIKPLKVGCLYRDVARLCFEIELPNVKNYEQILSDGDLDQIESFVQVRDIFLALSSSLRQALIQDGIRLPGDFADVITYSEEPEDDLEEIIIEIKFRNYSEVEKSIILLKVLKAVHDEWVRIHPERFFSEHHHQRCDFLQFELLGAEEMKSHRIYTDEIFAMFGLLPDRTEVTKQYWREQEAFLKQNGIRSREDLIAFIMKADYNPLARDICDILRTDRTVAEMMADN